MTIQVAAYEGPGTDWDEFAQRQGGFTHFHLHGWRAVIERVFGHECVYLAARDGDDRLVGILPLVRVRSFAFGHFLVSMPFVNYGGPLGSDEAVQALVVEASRIARSTRVSLLELRSRAPLAIDSKVSHHKITVVLDLPRSPETLFKSLDAKVRSQVRRSQKEGVVVRFGADQVEPFFSVFSRHMRDLGTPTQPQRLFSTLVDCFDKGAWVGCAYLEDAPIACGFGFRWGHEFEMTWASSLRAYNRIAPNMLLYWSFMERALADGSTIFNFGRCTPDSGTHRFKRQWGGRDETLWWYHPVSTGRSTTPSPNDHKFSWGPRVWRHLPAGLTSAIGPRIVRYIP